VAFSIEWWFSDDSVFTPSRKEALTSPPRPHFGLKLYTSVAPTLKPGLKTTLSVPVIHEWEKPADGPKEMFCATTAEENSIESAMIIVFIVRKLN
jgi:hypothetical protein